MKNIIVAMLVLACLVFGGGWQSRGRPRKGEPPRAAGKLPRVEAPEPVEIYKGLRERVLTSKPEELGIEGAGSKAYGVLMEIGLSNGLASIASFGTGDASLYAGTGGGILGGGGFPAVNRAARALVAEADKHLPRMALTKEFPYADVGRIRFYVLTRDGVYTAEAVADELARGQHALSPLFCAGNEVITQLRLNTEKK
jgi:hypothetical protein